MKPPYVLIVRPRTDPGGEPVAKLLIEHKEKLVTGGDGVIHEARLSVGYRLIGETPYGHRKQKHDFPACYVRRCGENGRICLTGSDPFGGAVELEPNSLQGNRIGSFLMNQVVIWATRWPDADINPITLVAHQGKGENRLRRNRFYEQFGITFDYADNTHATGVGRPMRAGSLTPWATLPENLTVITLEDFLDGQESALSGTLLDLKAVKRRNRDLGAELIRAFDHPIWFASKVLWGTHGTWIVSLVILLALILIFYRSR